MSYYKNSGFMSDSSEDDPLDDHYELLGVISDSTQDEV